MKYLGLIIFSFSVLVCKAQKGDPFPELRLFEKVYSKYSLDEQPRVPADTNMIAIWKMAEDVDAHNYFVLERYSLNEFVCTYMNRGGNNRTYENFGLFFSKVGNANFLNVGYRDNQTNTSGYFFLKVTDQDVRGWNMTLSLVTDTTLRAITSREALRERIAKNIDNPNFYGKPMHFRKKLPLLYCK